MTPPAILASKGPKVSLSARRGIARMTMTLHDKVGKANALAPDVKCVQTSPADSVEVRLASRPICQMGYDVHEALGCGTMAVVYRIARRSDGQEFAGKCVHQVDEEYRNFTREEHRIMQSLDHQNVLRSTAMLEFPSEIWLCTELCTEGNVQSYVKKHGAFPDDRCRALAQQLVHGTEHLHRRRIVHRDIKPENLLLARGATQLKIGDFNSAIKIGTRASGSKRTWMLSMRGTPLYAAPELRFDLPWNERVDIWTVGLSVYFMAQAASPFNVGNCQVADALRRGKLPTIQWQGMTAALAHLVEQCLAVDMRHRPTAMELLFHPAFEAVSGNQGGESAQAPVRCKSGSDSVVRSSCGLLFSCKSFQADRSGAQWDWQSLALQTLASERFPALKKLVALGVSDPWMI